ncbi:MAG: hypothetical protein HZC41_24950 [Chloroflexi bacterium]|nr:hypothetical protein [Chloroflexota bacterium]
MTWILLLIFASRAVRLDEMQMHQDEIWSVWQTFGTPAQIVRWTPYDWPPLYYLTLGVWRGLTNPHPVILRYSSALMFLFGTACLYRVARRLADVPAAALACLGYAALGYTTLLSMEVRGYALLLGLMPLAFWLTLRYFDRPHWQRAIPLGFTLVALFYTSVSSIGAFFILGVYTLIVYGRSVWRWWLPGLLAALLALPEIVNKVQYVDRTAATSQLVLPPLPQAVYNLFVDGSGNPFPVWALLLVTAIVALVITRRLKHPPVVALLLWVLAVPVLLYVVNPVLGFFSPRYAWWIMIGIALLAGIGLARLPRPLPLITGGILAVLAFVPLPLDRYISFNVSELGRNFTWLQEHLLPGDVLFADPSNSCGRPEEWDYYTRVFFPNGLAFVDDPAGYRRVWYVLFDGLQNPRLQDKVAEGRFMERFVGPPDANGVRFENGMRFHGVDILDNDHPWTGPLVRREGESVRLRLWWSVDAPPELDYSVGVYILRWDGVLIASSDSAPVTVLPADAPPETSRWQPGRLYVEERELTLPFPTPRATYTMKLAVYFWQDGKRLRAPGVDDEGLLPLHRLAVMSY